MTSSPTPASASPSLKEALVNQQFTSLPPPIEKIMHELLASASSTTIENEVNWYHMYTESAGKDKLDPSKSSNEILQACMSSLQKDTSKKNITATIRFASLLIHSGNHGATAISNTHSQQAGKVLHQLNQRILTVLQNLICPKDDSSNDFNADIIITNARWYLQLLLNVMEPIAGLNTVCATIWRGIGDIATALSQALKYRNSHHNDSVDEDKSLSTSQDYQYFEKAMERIYVLIREGFQTATIGEKQAVKMGKLLKFFFMRLIQLIPLLSPLVHDAESDNHGRIKDRDHSSLDRHLVAIIHFCGFVIQNRVSLGTDSANQLGQKINVCLDKLLSISTVRTPTNVTWTSIPHNPCILESLLQLHARGSANTNEFWLGKFDTFYKMLSVIASNLAEKKNKADAINLTGSEWAIICSMCENLVFQMMPRCYGVMTSLSASNSEYGIISAKVLNTIANVLILLERTACAETGVNSKRLLHRWMIRCLARNQLGNPEKDGSLHPLSSQIWTTILQNHAIRSFLHDCKHKLNALSDEITVSTNCDGLIRIMSKILFDKRTGALLRRNIGIIFYRLINTSSSKLVLLRKRIEVVLVSSYVDFLSTMKDKESSFKRKRNSSICSQWVNIKGFAEIGPLIEILSKSKIFWSKLSSSARDSLIEDCSSLLLVRSTNISKKEKRFSQLASKALDLTYVMASIMVGAEKQVVNGAKKLAHQNLLFVPTQQSIGTCYLGLSRLSRSYLSNLNQLSQKQSHHLAATVKSFSAQKSSVGNKYWAAIVLSSFGSVLSIQSSQAMESVS